MRIVSVVGTRPQLIKAAALQPALRARHEEIFVDTGQHYDEGMAGAFFAELGLPRPDHALGVGSGSHAEQTGLMLSRLEPVLLTEHPDAVLVFGDTNSTLAGALSAAKLGLPVAHVEAGLRSFDRQMPEEINRVVADRLSRWLFAPTPAAVANLAAEGMVDGVALVGDIMQDLAARVSREVADPGALCEAGEAVGTSLQPGAFILATIHRAENREPARRARSGPSWPARRRSGRGAPRLPDDARPRAACRGGAHRFRWRAARGGMARDALPCPPKHDGMGGSGGRLRWADGRRRPGSSEGPL